MLSQRKMIISSFLFGMGWFTVSFAFPLEAEAYGLDKIVTGILGLCVSLPFPLVAFIYLKAGDRYLLQILIAAQAAIVALTFLFVVNSPLLFVTLVVFTGTLQGFYWVSMEVSIGSVRGEKSAERYSAAWGIPSFISPVIAGFILAYLDFVFLVVISAIVLAASIPFIQRYRINLVNQAGSRLEIHNVIPLFFAGLVIGYFSYVLIPMLRSYGFEYTTLGIIGSILGASMAVGFSVFSILDSDNIRKLNLLSGILMMTPIVIAFTRSDIILGTVSALSGFGVAIAFSKVLSYLFRTSEPLRGIFYYELFIAIGYSSGSTIGGLLASFTGFESALVIFVLPLLYLIYVIRNRGPHYYPSSS